MGAERVRALRVPFPGPAPRHLVSYMNGDPALAPLYGHFPLGRPIRPPRSATSDHPVERETADRIAAMNRGEAPDLTDGKTRFVIAGQQPGLLLGPHITAYKILSIRALAGALREAGGGAVVPLFWIASHDSDRDEADTAVFPGPQGEPKRFRFPFSEDARRTQVGGLAIGKEEWRALLDSIVSDLPPSPFRDEIFEQLAGLAGEGTDVNELFARTARLLLPGSGVLFFDGRDAETGRRGRSMIAAAVREPDRTLEALREGASLLEKAGIEPPLPFDETRLPLFLVEAGVRIPLFFRDGIVLPEGGRSIEPADLGARIEEGAVRATPAAALRPVIQDGIFPNLATVVGQSELVYHGQLGPLYELLGVRRPPLVPRASFYILASRTAEKIERAGWSTGDLLAGDPPGGGGSGIEKALARFRESIGKSVDEAVREVEQEFPGAVPSDDTARRRMIKEAERTAERLEKLADRAGGNRKNLAHRVRNELLPGGKAQELVTSFLYTLVRYGPGIVEALADAVEPGDGLPNLIIAGGRDRS